MTEVTNRVVLNYNPHQGSSYQALVNDTNYNALERSCEGLSQLKQGQTKIFQAELPGGKIRTYKVSRQVQVADNNKPEEYLHFQETNRGIFRALRQFLFGETGKEVQARSYLQNLAIRMVLAQTKKVAAINHMLPEQDFAKCSSVIKGEQGFPAVISPCAVLDKVVDRSKSIVLMLDLDENIATSSGRNSVRPESDIYCVSPHLAEKISALKRDGVKIKVALNTRSHKVEGQIEDKLNAAGIKLNDIDYTACVGSDEFKGDKKEMAGQIMDRVSEEEGYQDKQQVQVLYFDDEPAHLKQVNKGVREAGYADCQCFQTVAHTPVSAVRWMKFDKPETEPEADEQVLAGIDKNDKDFPDTRKKAWKVTEAELFKNYKKEAVMSYLLLNMPAGKPLSQPMPVNNNIRTPDCFRRDD